MARSPAALRSPRVRRSLLAAAALCLLLSGAEEALAATYHVDPATGVDDVARDATNPAEPWRTITFAIEQADDGANHEIRLAAGEYSQDTGEFFPLALPPTVSLVGAGRDVTTLRDLDDLARPTIAWVSRMPANIASDREIRDLQILRDPPDSAFSGVGIRVGAEDGTAEPVLTNLTIRGAVTGIDAVAYSVYAAAVNAVRIDAGFLTANFWGIAGYANTYAGQTSRVDPIVTNTILAGNFADGAIFETTAAYGLSSGQRRSASSSPVLTHCTLADNIGSGLHLYNYNLGYRSGAVTATVLSSILARNGDYSVLEESGSTDAVTFRNNLLGGEQLALYLDEGTDPLTAIAQVNANVDGPNLEGVPEFADGLEPTWRLRADSPGVDQAEAGLLPVDIEGDARPIDGDLDGDARPDIGADEAPGCAVDVIVDPPTIEDQCGPDQVLTLDASLSAPAAGYACSVPLEHAWYDDGVLFSTEAVVEVNPTESTTYTVVVTCPDAPNCRDSAELPVVVHPLPSAAANGPYQACIDAGATDAEIELSGVATPPMGGFIEAVAWTTDTGVIFGAATTEPILVVDNTGENQVVTVTFTVTDAQGCTDVDTTTVSIYRGPVADAGGPYVACQEPEAAETSIPLTGAATPATGSTIAAWDWTSDVGRIVGGDGPTPTLVLRNLPFTREATVTVTATDDQGCTGSASALVTLHPSPSASPGGPYQMQEDMSGTTSFNLTGAASGGAPPLELTWTTDLGTFRSTGTAMVMGTTTPTLDIVNTGADQTANVCLQAVDANDCGAPACTVALVRTSPPVPPNPVGPTFRVRKGDGEARLSWPNAVPDATHDIATSYSVWESQTPGGGGWAIRPGFDAVPPESGRTTTTDATLLDPAGPDLLFLKVVSQNDAGAACADPELELPNCG